MSNESTQASASNSPALLAILDYLRLQAGVYVGEGRNHDGEPFLAEFHLKMIAGGNGGQISFRARDGEMVFHEERTWIAHDLIHERIALWTLSTNAPGVLRLDLREDSSNSKVERAFVFGFGNPESRDRFREEIRLEFDGKNGAAYVYSWGVPDEDFAVRTQATLKKQETPLPPSWL